MAKHACFLGTWQVTYCCHLSVEEQAFGSPFFLSCSLIAPCKLCKAVGKGTQPTPRIVQVPATQGFAWPPPATLPFTGNERRSDRPYPHCPGSAGGAERLAS